MAHGKSFDEESGGKYVPLRDEDDPRLEMFNRPLPCFGCGIGWFSLLLGFVCPLLWYYAAILYLCNYYQKDPRERGGLAASAITALICTVAIVIFVLVMYV